MITVVGDAFSRSMVRVLSDEREAGGTRKLDTVRVIVSSETMLLRDMKDALVAHLAQVMIILDIVENNEAVSSQQELFTTVRTEPNSVLL